MARTQAEFACFSGKDAEAYPRYDAALNEVAQVLRDCDMVNRPDLAEDFHGRMSLDQLWAARPARAPAA